MSQPAGALFHLKERGTNVRTEVVAGATTFDAMACILAVNPGMRSASGMDFRHLFSLGWQALPLSVFQKCLKRVWPETPLQLQRL